MDKEKMFPRDVVVAEFRTYEEAEAWRDENQRDYAKKLLIVGYKDQYYFVLHKK